MKLYIINNVIKYVIVVSMYYRGCKGDIFFIEELV